MTYILSSLFICMILYIYVDICIILCIKKYLFYIYMCKSVSMAHTMCVAMCVLFIYSTVYHC